MDPTLQLSLITNLVNSCSAPQLTFLNTVIAPKLKRDFLRDLPLELAHHILSFIDDPQSLARVGLVSRFWHQLVETEDWVWRAQCIKLFGPTSCSSLPSPKSHIALPTSFLYTTSPTSLDAVSSTLKALSSSSSGSTVNTPASHRLSLASCSTSEQSSTSSSTKTSPAWMNARELPIMPAAAAAAAITITASDTTATVTTDETSTPASVSTAGPSNMATSTVLSSMLLANQGSMSSPVGQGPSAAASPFSTLSSTTILRSRMTSRLVATSAIASTSTNAAPASAIASTSTLPPTLIPVQGLNLLSALPTLENRGVTPPAGISTSLLSAASAVATASSSSALSSNGKNKAREPPLSDLEGLHEQQQQHLQPLPHQHHRQTTSYKAYFKRRYLIDRNWISGRHSLISNTTHETGVVTSLQFDHHHIVVGCDNSRIQIFETTTGRLLRTLQGHLGGVWALEFVKGVGPTGGEKLLVSGGCDREVRVWDMNTGKCRLVMSGHNGTIRCLKLHQLPLLESRDNLVDDDINASDGYFPILNNKHPYHRHQRHDHQQQQQKQRSKHRHIVITGSRDSTLRVWDIQTGQNLFLLQGHTDSVRCIEVHGDILVSGSYDCSARVWSLRTGECLLHLQGHFQQIYSIAFNGEYIITGSLDSTCRLWSPVSGACLATLQGHTQLVGQLQLSGDSLMTGGGDGFMYLWNLRSMVCQYRVQAHEQSVTSLCFDAKRVVTGGNDGAVKLWDRQTGKFIRLLTKTDAAIWRVAICEERVVVCMQKNGRTAMEVMCFDSEAPVLPKSPSGGSRGLGSMGPEAAYCPV
ncbi:hypothetical protein EDD11_008294 [Mortierella claussenii]|nr:hypothetical protein EDD11_008294 [Mortierella claussenii]